MIKTVEELSQVREQALQDLQRYDCRVLVCSGTGCIATGSNKIHELFEDLVKDAPGVQLVFSPCGGHDDDKVVGVKKTGCQGFCELGPLVRVQKGDKVVQYVKVQPEDCQDIFEQTVMGDEVIDRLLYKKNDQAYVSPDEIPFIAKLTIIAVMLCIFVGPEALTEYRRIGVSYSITDRRVLILTRTDFVEYRYSDAFQLYHLQGKGHYGSVFFNQNDYRKAANIHDDDNTVICGVRFSGRRSRSIQIPPDPRFHLIGIENSEEVYRLLSETRYDPYK